MYICICSSKESHVRCNKSELFPEPSHAGLCCSVLQCAAVCCSVLQCVAM